jgi:hypothetical protein
MSKKSSKQQSIGYFTGGIIKKGKIIIAGSEEKVPNTLYSKMQELYGKSIKCRYVYCENSEKTLKEYKKLLDDVHDCGNVYTSHDDNAVKFLKDASGESKAHMLNLDEKTKTKKSNGEKKESKKKESKKKKEDDEDEKVEEVEEDEKDDKKDDKKDDDKDEEETGIDEKEDDEDGKEDDEDGKEDDEDEDEKPKKKGRGKK